MKEQLIFSELASEQFIFSELAPERLLEALSLIRNVFLEYEAPEYSSEGVQEFINFIEPEAIKKMQVERNMRIWTCDCDGQIVGALAARETHIHLLFVSGQYHRRGIARQLFNLMLKFFNPSEVTVSASPYALEAYRRLGFDCTDTEQTVNGLRFTPMKYFRL